MEAVIKRSIPTFNEFNAEITSFETMSEIDGQLELLGGDFKYKAGKMTEHSSHLFVTFEIVDVVAGDYLLIDGRYYKINYVDNPMMMNDHLEIEMQLDENMDADFKNYRYFGVSTKDNLTVSEIEQLGSEEIENKAFIKQVDATNQYIYFAYPVKFGLSTIRKNQFVDTSFTRTEVQISNQTYHVYRSQLLTDLNIQIQIV